MNIGNKMRSTASSAAASSFALNTRRTKSDRGGGRGEMKGAYTPDAPPSPPSGYGPVDAVSKLINGL